MSVRPTWALIAANTALALLLGWLWLGPGGQAARRWQPPPPIKPELGSPGAGALGPDDADTSRFMAILDRPLFSQNRRPAPVAASASGAPDPLDGIQLVGLYGGAGGGGLIARVDGKSVRVRVGENLGSWMLKAVRGHEAEFERGGVGRTVALVRPKSESALAGAVGAGPGSGMLDFAGGRPVPRAQQQPGLEEALRRKGIAMPQQPSPQAAAPSQAPVPAPQPVPAAAPAPSAASPTPSGAPKPPPKFTIGGSSR